MPRKRDDRLPQRSGTALHIGSGRISHVNCGVVERGTIRTGKEDQMPERNVQKNETCKLSDKLEDYERNLRILWEYLEPSRQ